MKRIAELEAEVERLRADISQHVCRVGTDRAEQATAQAAGLAEALEAIASGKVMTQQQPWPDSAEDHLEHTRRHAAKALVDYQRTQQESK